MRKRPTLCRKELDDEVNNDSTILIALPSGMYLEEQYSFWYAEKRHFTVFNRQLAGQVTVDIDSLPRLKHEFEAGQPQMLKLTLPRARTIEVLWLP